jgi:hypothetical protein
MTGKVYSCSGPLKTPPSHKKSSPASSPSLPASSASKIPTSLLVGLKTAPFQFTTFAKNPTPQSHKIVNLLTNTQMLFGTFSGSPKAKAERAKPSYQSAPMVELPNGQWKKVLNATIWCSCADCLKTTRNKTSTIWTSDSPVVYHLNSSKVSLQCTWPQLKKA